MSETSGYILGEAQGETERLERQASIDPVRQRALLAGVRAGMTIVDAGCGPGAVARQLAQIAGPAGRVVAFDLSTERLQAGIDTPPAPGSAPIEYRTGDVRAPPVDEGFADLVWCQYVLEYLPDPLAAVRALARLLRPGGRLVLVDVDGIGLFNHPEPALVREGAPKLLALLARTGFDAFVGRKLFHLLVQAGLENRDAKVEPYRVSAGTAAPDEIDAWQQRFTALAPLGAQAFGDASAYAAFTDAYIEMLRDPESFSYATVIVATGQRL